MIRRVARGRHGAENLSREEACQALERLLQEDADALQLGAFLIAERMKGETVAELAGFVDAARAHVRDFGVYDAGTVQAVDLPCYAGKRRAAPLHLIAALRARDEGIRILVHGVADIPGRLSAWQTLRTLGVDSAGDLASAARMLERDGIAYLDLADVCPPLQRLFMLRPRLGVRSFANTVARLLNPMRCVSQLNGIFHTPYARVMAMANRLLDQPASLIFAGAEGEPELYATRQRVMIWQRGSRLRGVRLPDLDAPPYPKAICDCPEQLQADMLRIMCGKQKPAEQLTLARMRAAFIWAQAGFKPEALPGSWTFAEDEERGDEDG